MINEIYKTTNDNNVLLITDNVEEHTVNFSIIKGKYYNKKKCQKDQMIFSYESLMRIYLWLLNPKENLYIECNCFCELLEIALFIDGILGSVVYFRVYDSFQKWYNTCFEMNMFEVTIFKNTLHNFLYEKGLLHN